MKIWRDSPSFFGIYPFLEKGFTDKFTEPNYKLSYYDCHPNQP